MDRKLQSRLWNREYTEKGNLWRGPAHLDADFPEGSRVLELGCGSGKTLSALLKRDCKLTAIDTSAKALSICEGLASRVGREVELLQADVCNMSFPDSSFDAIFAYHILDHLLKRDRQKAASEITRVLAPGGTLFVRTFSLGDMRFGKGEEAEQNTFSRGKNKLLYHYFSQKELRELFSSLAELSSTTTKMEVTYNKKHFTRERIIASYMKP